MSQRCSAVLSEIHRTILGELRRIRGGGAPMSLLDVGCWDGAGTAAYREVLGGPAAGIEVYPEPAAVAEGRGIEVAGIDLERERFPWGDASFDVVVVNQVFEHLKNIWLPMSEVARVTSPGGVLVFSVPNLASLHNRALLALGLQPSSIRTFGPHVRGYAYREARGFVEHGGYFEIERALGVGFYPLPVSLARLPAGIWVSASHTPVLVARRKEGGAPYPWTAAVHGPDAEQTFYTPAG
jgi:SAM-dependent methyltransferase